MGEGQTVRDAHAPSGGGLAGPVAAEYQRTEAGVIPEDWSVTSISAIASVKTGPFGSALHERDYVDHGTPIVTVEHLGEHGIRRTNLPRVSDADRLRLKGYLLRAQDIVFSRVGSVDRNSLISENEAGWLFSGRLLRVRMSSECHTSARYLSYHLHTESFKKRVRSVAVGQTMASLNTQILKAVRVVIPPLLEQRAIAAVLSDVDELIGSLEELIAKKRAIKQAAMQELLAGRKRLPGFRGEWKRRRLGELANMTSGGTPPTSVAAYYGGDVPWVSISDMTGSGKITTSTDKNLSHLGLENSAAHLLPAGTVLYAMYASLGECSIAGRPVSTSQAILGIQPGPSLDHEFLYYWLSRFKGTVKVLGQQGTQSNLNKGIVQGLRVELPPLPEQRAIADVLSGMDDEVAALERQLAKTRSMKQGMMQELLTGRVRLPLPPPEQPESSEARDA